MCTEGVIQTITEPVSTIKTVAESWQSLVYLQQSRLIKGPILISFLGF